MFGNMTVNFIDCNGNPQTFTAPAGEGVSICACEGSVTTSGGVPVIIPLGPCGS
jgi:hypothetical protein